MEGRCHHCRCSCSCCPHQGCAYARPPHMCTPAFRPICLSSHLSLLVHACSCLRSCSFLLVRACLVVCLFPLVPTTWLHSFGLHLGSFGLVCAGPHYLVMLTRPSFVLFHACLCSF